MMHFHLCDLPQDIKKKSFKYQGQSIKDIKDSAVSSVDDGCLCGQ